MICKSCGTECRGSFCSHCGEPLINEAYVSPLPPVPVAPHPSQTDPTNSAPHASSAQPEDASSDAPVTVEAEQDAPTAPVAKHAKHGSQKPRITLRQVFFPALALLLPLFYLFLDVFVLYADLLFAETDGVRAISLLVSQLSQAEFASNPVSDLVTATFGNGTVLLEPLTVKAILTGGEAYAALRVPALVLSLLAVIGGLCGILVLFSAGRLLRVRAFSDTVVIGGTLSALAPLLAGVAFRVMHLIGGGTAAADAAMQKLGFSVETVLLCGLTLTLTLPAVRALRRAVAGEGIYLTAPCRVFARRFGLIRLLGTLACLAALLLPLAAVVLPVASDGTLLASFLANVTCVGGNLGDIKGVFGEASLPTVAKGLYGILTLPVLPVMAISTLVSFVSLMRLLCAKPSRVVVKKRNRKGLMRTGRALRRAPRVIAICYILFLVLAVLLLLLATSLKAHVDTATISDTLLLLYLVIAEVKLYGILLTSGVLLVSLSLLFATIAGSFAKAFVVLSFEKQKNE